MPTSVEELNMESRAGVQDYLLRRVRAEGGPSGEEITAVMFLALHNFGASASIEHPAQLDRSDP